MRSTFAFPSNKRSNPIWRSASSKEELNRAREIKQALQLKARCKTGVVSERAQEIDDSLLLFDAQLIELVDDLVGLAAAAFVSPDGFNQVGSATVVEKEVALADAPERCSPELVWASAALRNAIGEAFTHVVNEQVGPEVRRLVREGSAWDRRGAAGNHLTGSQRTRVAVGTAYFDEGGSPVRNGGRVGSRRGWGKHAHKVGKSFDVGNDGGIRGGGSRGSGEVKRVIRCSGEKTGGSLVALLREQWVRNAHLHVVGFGRKQEQGFVLRLPTETSDGPIVGAAVDVPAQMRVRVAGNT